MIRKVVDRAHSVVSTNFNTDFSDVAAGTGVPLLTLAAGDFFNRMAAEIFQLKVAVGIGVYHDGGATTRRRPGAGSAAAIRDSRIDVVLDWWITGANPDDVAAQTELAVQALLRSIDRMPDGTNIIRAAEGEDAVRWEIQRTQLSAETRIAVERALIRFPAWTRETGL